MAICNNKKCSLGECEQPETCAAYVPVITNADRIRSMSDEDLAELIVVSIKDIHHQGMRELAYSAWLEWLQKPAEKPKEGE